MRNGIIREVSSLLPKTMHSPSNLPRRLRLNEKSVCYAFAVMPFMDKINILRHWSASPVSGS